MSEDYDPIGDDPADAVQPQSKERRGRKPKDNGANGQPQAKSDARIIEDVKAIAAAERAAPNILGAGKKKRIDLTRIRADVSAPLGATNASIRVIPVRKPGDQKCFRTYPQDQWFTGAAIAIREDDRERKPYLFSAEMAALVPAQVGL